MITEDKPDSHRRLWRWLIYLLIGLAISNFYANWKVKKTKSELFSFNPSEMALVQYTSKHVIGDFGGVKVQIPRNCAENVEYDNDPGFGEKRKGAVPERTFKSKLRSFGMNVRFPEMKCSEYMRMHEEKRRNFLATDNPWVSIGINAGEIYPMSGAEAADKNAKIITNTTDNPTEFWFANFERLPGLVYGLEAYVVSGVDPTSGKPARENERVNDKFIHRAKSGIADTYISCGKTYVVGGVASCQMGFGLEPKAQAHLSVIFVRSLLPQWREIRHSVSNFLMSFEVKNGVSEQSIDSAFPSLAN